MVAPRPSGTGRHRHGPLGPGSGRDGRDADRRCPPGRTAGAVVGSRRKGESFMHMPTGRKAPAALATGAALTAALMAPQPAQAVVGGTESTQAYSFMGSFQLSYPALPRPDQHGCGVEVLAPQWVLTDGPRRQESDRCPGGCPAWLEGPGRVAGHRLRGRGRRRRSLLPAGDQSRRGWVLGQGRRADAPADPGRGRAGADRLGHAVGQDPRRGHGLGLAIALGQAQVIGASLPFANAPDGGAVATLRLPVAD